MCQRIQCERCGKPSWTGCGRHVEEALAGVKPQDRCACPPAPSLMSRIFGRPAR